MATLDTTVTNDWVDIKTSLSLTVGSRYVIDSAIGGMVYISFSSTTPTVKYGHRLEPKGSRVVTITSEKLWVRSDTDNAKIVLTVEV